jgi:hypothetical protein
LIDTASLTPRTLTTASTATEARREHQVPRTGVEPLETDAAEVVGGEERRDRDRDHVVEHLRPGREERPELVEGAASEQGRPARLREHRGRLGVGRRRAVEERAREHEDQGREAQGERRDEAQRVVDRRPDVPVRRREQRVGPENALKTRKDSSCHGRRMYCVAGGPGARRAAAAARDPATVASSVADPWQPHSMPVIERLDFLGVPTQDPERARAFYRDVLGMRPDEHGEWEQWAGDTCFGIWEPEKQGMPFVAQKGNPWPLRCDDVAEMRAALEAKGVQFFGDTSTPASATWRSSPIPTATSSCCTAGTRRTSSYARQ